MRNSTLVIGLLLVLGLAGCGGSAPSTAPTAPSLPIQTVRSPYPPANSSKLVGVTLSGRVLELTSTEPVPLEGVKVYCDACGEGGHSWVFSDANGYYSFSADLGLGGGIWLSPGYATYLIVGKEGYQDPTGLPAPTYPTSNAVGWREVTVTADTQFDIQLIRR